MATGFKGLSIRRKTWSGTYSPGTTVVYTVPTDVMKAKIFIKKIEGLNIDTSERIDLKIQRSLNGTFTDVITFAQLLPSAPGPNLDLAMAVNYHTDSALSPAFSVINATSSNGDFVLAEAVAGDRIVAVVTSSGETFTVDAYIEETTATTTAI
jgi:hypothetical protein